MADVEMPLEVVFKVVKIERGILRVHDHVVVTVSMTQQGFPIMESAPVLLATGDSFSFGGIKALVPAFKIS